MLPRGLRLLSYPAAGRHRRIQRKQVNEAKHKQTNINPRHAPNQQTKIKMHQKVKVL